MEFKSGFITKQQVQNSGTASENAKEQSEETVYLLLTKQYVQAYAVLKELLSHEKNVFSLFNTALCLMEAGKPADAAANLEEALNMCKKDLAQPPLTTDFTAAELEKAENESESYNSPLTRFEAKNFVQFTKIKIVRLLADAYLKSSNWQKLTAMGANPGYMKFKNVKTAVETAKG